MENRFLRCAMEHKEAMRLSRADRSPSPGDNRFLQTAMDHKREKASSSPPAPNYHLYNRRQQLAKKTSKPAQLPTYVTRPIAKQPALPQPTRLEDIEKDMLEKAKTLEKVSIKKSNQDVRTDVARAHSFDEMFPSLPSSPLLMPRTPKTPKGLPGVEPTVIIQEIPLPEPVAIAIKPDGTQRKVYSLTDPYYVPPTRIVTVVEKTKSACWSQRLKDSLANAEAAPLTNPEDDLIEDEDGFPLVRSTLSYLDL